MKKFILIIIATLTVLPAMVSCLKDNEDWKAYEELYNNNENWLNEQIAKKDANGNPYFTKLVADWDSQTVVYIHYHNDTMLTKDNYRPYLTSTIEVKYRGQLYNGAVFDSTAVDSTYRTQLTKVIPGWQLAMFNTHVGDSVQIMVPYAAGYGTTGSGSIPPYSNLLFDIKLVSIPGLVIP